MADERKKDLVLEIRIPSLPCDDLEAAAALLGEALGEPESEDLLFVLEDEIRFDVGVTIVTLPGEKCGNDDFYVTAHNGVIVGARVVDRGVLGLGGSGE